MQSLRGRAATRARSQVAGQHGRLFRRQLAIPRLANQQRHLLAAEVAVGSSSACRFLSVRHRRCQPSDQTDGIPAAAQTSRRRCRERLARINLKATAFVEIIRIRAISR